MVVKWVVEENFVKLRECFVIFKLWIEDGDEDGEDGGDFDGFDDDDDEGDGVFEDFEVI